jgi:uncharacterized protein YdeI (BOF family)
MRALWIILISVFLTFSNAEDSVVTSVRKVLTAGVAGQVFAIRGIIVDRAAKDGFFLQDDSGQIVVIYERDKHAHLGLRMGSKVIVTGEVVANSGSRQTQLKAYGIAKSSSDDKMKIQQTAAQLFMDMDRSVFHGRDDAWYKKVSENVFDQSGSLLFHASYAKFKLFRSPVYKGSNLKEFATWKIDGLYRLDMRGEMVPYGMSSGQNTNFYFVEYESPVKSADDRLMKSAVYEKFCQVKEARRELSGKLTATAVWQNCGRFLDGEKIVGP